MNYIFTYPVKHIIGNNNFRFKILRNGRAREKQNILSISLKTAVGIFEIVDNTGVVTQLILVKLENYVESLQRMSLNEN